MEKVSVIIPAYNKADLTVKTIESVLNQTYANIEIIVIDDGSTDNTKTKVSQFGDKIKFIAKENGGACSARNVGIKEATGKYIAFIDCDDLYEPNKIQLSVEYLEANPQYGFVHTAANFIDDQGKMTGEYSHRKSKEEGKVTNQLILGNFVCNSTPMIRKDTLEKIGFFDETIFAPADWDMWLRLSEIAEVGYIDQPLTHYRVTGNYTFTNLDQSYEDELVVLERFFERNPKLSSMLKRQIYSNFHLRYAQCFLIKDNTPRMMEEFSKSLKANPLNIKALLMFVYYLVAKTSLKAKLETRILRQTNS